ncbi:HAD-IA family hydrolase [Idiomarina seosinensis]|uniref:HAD family hydrolase n=1 Tax=Idiomarina seosinensis TaxID=281739 RepID=A0A432ZHX4_9GAMM|nr:HAD-IA family hydrolase [Idiomarina seosinensis]RUO77625.1 HAD family hydrolase [Idiomarina seosinensis]
MTSPQLIIFDWDGTLMDSIARIVSSMQATASFLKLKVPSDNAVKDIIGLSLEPAIEQLFGTLPAAQHQLFLERYRDEYIELNTTPTPLFRDALVTIEKLRTEQHYLAVATGKARRGLDRVWAELEIADLFHGSRCADETKGKPDPEMLYQLMSELDFSPQQTLMVGDSVHDMRMAKAAGVKAIGVTFGVHNEPLLRQAGADHVIRQLHQLPDLIKGLLCRKEISY